MGVLRIGLTGVNGFIGNQVLEEFLKVLPGDWNLYPHSEIRFVGSDLLETQTRFTARRFAGSARYTFMPHTEFLDALEGGQISLDLVVHNGACSSTTETDPEIFERLNLGYSKRVWNICAEKRIPLIYASSASVYGDGQNGFSDDPDRMHTFSAMNLYARSKLDFDRFAWSSPVQPPLWFGLRYFNVFGPFEGHKMGQASMVYHGFQQAIRTGTIRLFRGAVSKTLGQPGEPGCKYGDGEQMRDFVWVGDVVKLTALLAGQMLKPKSAETLLEKALSYRGRQGVFLNVGSGHARSWNDLAAGVFAALGKVPQIAYFEMPESLRRQYQDFTQAEHSALPALGLNPQWTSLEDAIRIYVQKTLLRNIEAAQ